ncbi:hypothetical protein [Nonomuraea indica]|uniref:Transmembrane protein n=1 Tax=Nonomuraea indica TaxID=1581193 RepID=A0ABW7ZYE4_9ACTN|nr:hypothetical protein [Nonomuraea indica]
MGEFDGIDVNFAAPMGAAEDSASMRPGFKLVADDLSVAKLPVVGMGVVGELFRWKYNEVVESDFDNAVRGWKAAHQMGAAFYNNGVIYVDVENITSAQMTNLKRDIGELFATKPPATYQPTEPSWLKSNRHDGHFGDRNPLRTMAVSAAALTVMDWHKIRGPVSQLARTSAGMYALSTLASRMTVQGLMVMALAGLFVIPSDEAIDRALYAYADAGSKVKDLKGTASAIPARFEQWKGAAGKAAGDRLEDFNEALKRYEAYLILRGESLRITVEALDKAYAVMLGVVGAQVVRMLVLFALSTYNPTLMTAKEASAAQLAASLAAFGKRVRSVFLSASIVMGAAGVLPLLGEFDTEVIGYGEQKPLPNHRSA